MIKILISLFLWILWLPIFGWLSLGVYRSDSNVFEIFYSVLGVLAIFQFVGILLHVKSINKYAKRGNFLIFIPAIGAVSCYFLFIGAIMLRMILNENGLQDWP